MDCIIKRNPITTSMSIKLISTPSLWCFAKREDDAGTDGGDWRLKRFMQSQKSSALQSKGRKEWDQSEVEVVESLSKYPPPVHWVSCKLLPWAECINTNSVQHSVLTDIHENLQGLCVGRVVCESWTAEVYCRGIWACTWQAFAKLNSCFVGTFKACLKALKLGSETSGAFAFPAKAKAFVDREGRRYLGLLGCTAERQFERGVMTQVIALCAPFQGHVCASCFSGI